jgi:metallophosphoesterase superfamily enzyme
MSAFDTAMASLIADPHLGCDAEYRQGGTGALISLRVLRSSPDRMADWTCRGFVPLL